MSPNLPHSIPPSAREALAASGLPWRLEPGKRHVKLVLCGKVVAVVPRGKGKDGRSQLNLAAGIRRAIKREQEARR